MDDFEFAFDDGDFDDFGDDFASDDKNEMSSRTIIKSEAKQTLIAKNKRLEETTEYPKLTTHYLSALADTMSVRDFLQSILVTKFLVEHPKPTRKRRRSSYRNTKTNIGKYCTDAARSWSEQGKYKAAISAAIIAHINYDKSAWPKITEVAIEHDQLDQLILAIQDHRAKQAGVKLYLELLHALFDLADARINVIWKQLIHYIENMRNVAAASQCFIILSMLSGITDFRHPINQLWRQSPDASEEDIQWVENITGIINADNISMLHIAHAKFLDMQLERGDWRQESSLLFGDRFDVGSWEIGL